jgi:molecular chaperone GrpE (heat shock protein)
MTPASSDHRCDLSPAPSDAGQQVDLLANKPWVRLVEECVTLFDEIERLHSSLDDSSRDFADHVKCRFLEILERSGVTIISGDALFDGARHQADSLPGEVADNTPITETLSPGFSVERRVFRRARVKIAEVPPTEKGPEQ